MNANLKTLILAAFAAALTLPAGAQDNSGSTRDILITPNDGAAPDVEYDEPEAAINTKDLLIEQANLYNISPGNGGRHGQHHGTRQRTSVSLWVNDHDNTYNIGENIIFYAKAKRDGYLTIIDVGTSGKVRQLFPNRYQPENYVRRGQTIQIPARNAAFRYTIAGPTGTELVKAIISSSPESIYGNSAKNFNDDIFPGYNADAETLTGKPTTKSSTSVTAAMAATTAAATGIQQHKPNATCTWAPPPSAPSRCVYVTTATTGAAWTVPSARKPAAPCATGSETTTLTSAATSTATPTPR